MDNYTELLLYTDANSSNTISPNAPVIPGFEIQTQFGYDGPQQPIYSDIRESPFNDYTYIDPNPPAYHTINSNIVHNQSQHDLQPIQYPLQNQPFRQNYQQNYNQKQHYQQPQNYIPPPNYNQTYNCNQQQDHQYNSNSPPSYESIQHSTSDIIQQTPLPGQTVIQNGTTTVVQEAPENYNMFGHIVFSCIVAWCCNVFFGIIAFAVAMSGLHAPIAKAKKLGFISLGLNIAGIVITAILIGVIVVYWTQVIEYTFNN